MPVLTPAVLYVKRESYINGAYSLKCFLDLMLTIIIALYSRKQVKHKVDNTTATTIRVSVFYWSSYYQSDFRRFSVAFCKYFEYKNNLPFIFKRVAKSDLPNMCYDMVINYDFYQNLDEEFLFPNLNDVIMSLLTDYCIVPCFDYEPKLLKFCKLEYSLSVFTTPTKSGESSSTSNEPDVVPLKMEARQLKQTNEMLSQMIEHIYTTMVNEDYSRLQAVIFDVHAIYSSKKRGRSDESEEVPYRKPRIEDEKRSEEIPSQKVDPRVDDTPEYD